MEDTKQLVDAINNLSTVIRRTSSYNHRMISGLVTGLATVIGATVFAGLVLYSLGFLIKQIDLSDYPTIQEMMQKANIIKDTDK